MDMYYIIYSVILVIVQLCIVLAGPADTLVFYDTKQDEYIKQLRDYDVIYPSRVTHEGQFLSHRVHHTVDYTKQRNKRSTDDQTVHFKIHIEGKEKHLTLEPNHGLYAPGLTVLRSHGDVMRSSAHRYDHSKHCQFRGTLLNHTRSKVAVGTCEGLHGLIQTEEAEYFIEPVKGYNKHDDSGHPHIIYKTTSLPPHLQMAGHEDNEEGHTGHGTCGVTGHHHKAGEKHRTKWEKHHQHNQNKSMHHRSKRSYSLERYVETLIVVDRETSDYYKNENIEAYIFTVMNMVANIYHDTTLGNAVNINIVSIMVLEKDEKDLDITHHADNSLKSFCRWQNSINIKSDTDPKHHDVAILITRKNICARSNAPCSTLGLAQVSGLCQPHRSCSINEDTGLSLAYTIAHELGHNFGMQHDGAQTGCDAHHPEYMLVMAPQLTVEATPMLWSKCSRDAITRFLDRDWGYCLNDEPNEIAEFKAFSILPPGVRYDVDHQCRLQYGETATYCAGIDDKCQTLWCQVDNKCLTRLEAPAVGTICGKDKWCFNGTCVDQEQDSIDVVDGGWGEWGPWSGCTRSCGAGVARRERHCVNPVPGNGGKYCLGERKKFRICNTDECPENDVTFQDVQCKTFNDIPYKGHYYEWVAEITPMKPCQLHCKPKHKLFSVLLKDMVEDGTPCKPGTRHMCISGRCRTVGCDWKIDSDAKDDKCGICRGSGLGCKTIREEFKDPVGIGYVEATIIPKGAHNIRVEEVAEAKNYLAARGDNGKYFLNGDWYIQWSGDYLAAGTVLHYERDGNKETFTAQGPLKEPLHIMLLFQSENPGITFEYSVPDKNSNHTRRLEFRWQFLDWTHCTASCGGGEQWSEVVCVEKEEGQVDDKYCNATTRPDSMRRKCNSDIVCPAKWWAGQWQHCSRSCGTEGMHRRTVICLQEHHAYIQALEDHHCEGSPKPHEVEPCHHLEPCPDDVLWKSGPWSQTCQGDPCGRQRRDVYCEGGNHGKTCDEESKPPTERQCSNMTCGHWDTGNWSPCTLTCGPGFQLRSVICVGGDACRANTEPSSLRECTMATCTVPKMVTQAEEKTENLDIKHEQADAAYQQQTSDSGNNEVDNSVLVPKGDLKVKAVEAEVEKPSVETMGAFDIGLNNDDGSSESSSMFRYVWHTNPWTACNALCGGGSRVRTLTCYDMKHGHNTNDSHCAHVTKPSLQQPCNAMKCTEWTAGNWTKCTASCGGGLQKRDAFCPEGGVCVPQAEPNSHRECNSQPCLEWQAGPWSVCTHTCGGGKQLRFVECVDSSTNIASTGCDSSSKPSDSRSCGNEACPDAQALEKAQEVCRANLMSYHVCKALKRMGRCYQRIVQYKCCRTCYDKSRPQYHTRTALKGKLT